MSSTECCDTNCSKVTYLEEDKCIFHCSKTQDNGWIVSFYDMNRDLHESKKSKWVTKKVQEFWREFNIYKSSNIIIEGFKFPIYWKSHYKHESILDNLSSKFNFRECIFLDYFILHDTKEKENINTHLKEYVLTQDKNNKSD